MQTLDQQRLDARGTSIQLAAVVLSERRQSDCKEGGDFSLGDANAPQHLDKVALGSGRVMRWRDFS